MDQRLRTIEYFESLINEVNLKSEILLKRLSEIKKQLTDVDWYERIIQERRRKFIKEIDQTKNYNLSCLEDSQPFQRSKRPRLISEVNNEPNFSRICYILDKFDMNLREYMSLDNHNNNRLAGEFNFESTINENFGYLVIVQDGTISQHMMDSFKELLKYGEDDSQALIDHDDVWRAKFLKPIDLDLFKESAIFKEVIYYIKVVI